MEANEAARAEAAYRAGYAHLRELVETADPELLVARCPHCPEWTIKDVLAHLMIVVEGGLALKKPANFRQRVLDSIVNADDEDQKAAALVRDTGWNRAVAEVRDLTLEQLWARWDTALAADPGPWVAVVDFAVHVGDIDEALGVDSQHLDVYGISLKRYVFLANEQLKTRGLPTVRIEATDADLSAGDPAAQITIRGTTYEMLRIMTGRRTLQEAEEHVEWPDASDGVKQLLPVYGWLEESRQHVRAG